MSAAESDRELLELAAKAAGLRVKTWAGHTGPMCAIDDDRHGRMWMPLADDGDALRLAVRLRITPHIYGSLTDCEGCSVAHLSDPRAATRIAIVRAAAEIGRAMP